MHPRRGRRAALLSAALAAAVAAAVIGAAVPVAAHPQTPRVVREIVRLQGYLGEAPAGVRADREITLQVLAERYPMRVVDWQVYSTTEGAPTAQEPSELRLQGSREMLASFAALRDRRVTLLAERRPGSSEVFLLAVDACPPLPDAR